MKGKIVADWSKVDINSSDDRKQIFGALQHFMNAANPAYDKAGKALMQHFATSDDFPTSVLEVLKKFQTTTFYDNAFEQVFDMADFTSSNRNGFEILDVEDGLTFAEVPIGEAAKIYKFGGAKTTVSFNRYGAGLGWDRTLFDDKEYWTLENNAIAFRNKWYSSRAEYAYALIDAIGVGQNLAWQAVTPANVANTNENYNAIRDINTINAACLEILTDLKDKGFDVSPSTPFVLLAPIQLKARILRAMGLLNSGISGTQRGLVYPVTPHFTLGLTSSTTYYVCVPKIKAIFADRMLLTIFDKFDPQTYSDISVGWGRYGGTIGDTEQFQRCATS